MNGHGARAAASMVSHIAIGGDFQARGFCETRSSEPLSWHAAEMWASRDPVLLQKRIVGSLNKNRSLRPPAKTVPVALGSSLSWT